MEDRKLLKLTTGKLDPDDFSNSEHKEIFQLIKAEKKTSPALLLDKTENEKTKDLILRIAAVDWGRAEFSLQLDDHLTTLANFKKSHKIMALKDDIQTALQKGDVKTANRLTKEFEKLKKT